MGRCSVLGCRMKSYENHRNVTLHRLPTCKKRKEQWLDLIGIENLNTKTKHIFVCSLHFEDKCFNRTLNVIRLRDDALPSRELLPAQCAESEEQPSVSLRVVEEKPVCSTSNHADACRICLEMDAKLVSMKTYKLEQAYAKLTGILLSEEDKLPQKLCMECVQRLLNCSRFRLKSLWANSLMLEVIKKHDCLTVQNIETINRLNNQLTSSLSTKHFEVNHYDSYFEYEDQPVLIQDESPTTVNVDIEEANEIDLTEEIPDKNDDGLDESGVDDPGFDDDGFGDIDADALFEKDDVSEKEYVLSDKDNYSSDSLSLEKCETKKGRKRKQKDDKPVKTAKRAKMIQNSTEPKIDRRRKPLLNDDLNEALFTIKDLTVEEQIAVIVKRQESSNYKNALYKCTACFKGFADEDAYKNHMPKHTNQCGEHECEICKMHYKHKHALRKHISGIHTLRISCKQCTYETSSRSSARLHERWHEGKKYICPHCQGEFVRITSYMGHINSKHPSDFVCGLCGYSFVSAKGLEQHKKLKHSFDNVQIPEDGPLCELCNVRFISPDAHKRHLHKRHHIVSRESKGRQKQDGDSKKKRRLYPCQMKAEEPIPCEQCGIQLQSSRAYHYHFRRMHPDKNRTNYPSMKYPCLCEVCGKILQSFAHLRDHTRVHTGERPCKCDTCGKSFQMNQSLLFHKRIHSEDRKRYECTICGKHFSTYGNRQRHMVIHTGLKPFKCEMCGKAFKSVAEKRLHITYVHLKKPWPKRVRGKRRPKTRQGQLPPRDEDMDSQASMSPPCDVIDQEIEIEMEDNDPIIEDTPVIYVLKI